jgi:hypothetical protein
MKPKEVWSEDVDRVHLLLVRVLWWAVANTARSRICGSHTGGYENLTPLVHGKATDVSKEPALLATCFVLVSCFVYSSILKIEAKCSSESSLDFQHATRRCIPEDRTVHGEEASGSAIVRKFE